ncbi:MAG TPA: glucose 1-dehydrogenase [Caulobacteraceae bacterium]|jgi:NAD(P)-dependent dehydrogenase (short-subunit alcohol dehydrogenase family)|nr:glucose 1-dehydrogenase [Caulobacteraceae bacterium]
MTIRPAAREARFAGKVAAITGAASGIGRAIALRLAEEGAAVLAMDLAHDSLQDLADVIVGSGGRCEITQGSVADLSTIDRFLAGATSAFGGLDALVNNAGIAGPMKRLDQVEAAEFDLTVAVNLRPVWYAMKAAYPLLCERGGGAVLNVASMAGIRPGRHHAPYGMTKAGVISLTHHAAIDYAPANIRVNCLCPGPVDTPIFEQMRATMDPAAYQAARERLERRTLVRRFGSTEEQAAAAAFLLSDEAAFVTGVAMPVDGGWAIA